LKFAKNPLEHTHFKTKQEIQKTLKHKEFQELNTEKPSQKAQKHKRSSLITDGILFSKKAEFNSESVNN
jgi:type II secretory pathway component PulC